jgi:glycine cleavage system aminomethyltransferase T
MFGAIGLAVVRTDVASPGTHVEVAMPDGTTTGGTVDVLAVYDPKKERPRA